MVADRRCRVYAGQIWDNGNVGGACEYVTTVQKAANKGLAFRFFFSAFEVYAVIFVLSIPAKHVYTKNV